MQRIRALPIRVAAVLLALLLLSGEVLAQTSPSFDLTWNNIDAGGRHAGRVVGLHMLGMMKQLGAVPAGLRFPYHLLALTPAPSHDKAGGRLVGPARVAMRGLGAASAPAPWIVTTRFGAELERLSKSGWIRPPLSR